MIDLLAVGAGGFIGACARFGITKLLGLTKPAFPFATLVSNVIAGVAIGFIIGHEQAMGGMNEKWKLFLTTGLLGGLSTFSAFSLETVTLFGDGKYRLAAINILLNLILSLLGVLTGMWLARAVWKKA
jgi:CrcB protein